MVVAGAPPTLGAEGQGAQVRGQTLALRAEFSVSRTRTVGGGGGLPPSHIPPKAGVLAGLWAQMSGR